MTKQIESEYAYKRWEAAITYLLDDGQIEGKVVHMNELDELPDIIENGSDFRAVKNIVVTYIGIVPTTLLKASMEGGA